MFCCDCGTVGRRTARPKCQPSSHAPYNHGVGHAEISSTQTNDHPETAEREQIDARLLRSRVPSLECRVALAWMRLLLASGLFLRYFFVGGSMNRGT